MKLKQISYSCLKGRTETIELGDATLITGRNFSGKTCIIDGIKLALLGFHPSLDKTARGVFELSSGDEMSVCATLSETSTDVDVGIGGTGPVILLKEIKRTWKRVGSTVTKKDFIPPDFPETPIVLLDANEYFGKSDRGKVEMMFAAGTMRKREGGDPVIGQILDKLQEIGGGRAEGEKFVCDLRIYALDYKQLNAQQLIEEMLRLVEQGRSEANASVRRFAGTLQGLSHLQQQEPAKPLPENILAEIQTKRGSLEKLQHNLSDIQRARGIVDKTISSEENAVSEAKQEIISLRTRIADKNAQKTKTEQRWNRLLQNEDCPMCGAASAIWRSKAESDSQAELAEIARELLELCEQRTNRENFVKENEPKAKKQRETKLKTFGESIDRLEEQIANMREEIASLEKGQQRYMNELADRKRLAEAREELDKAERQEKQLKEAKKWLLEKKAEMVREMFEPILTVARSFTKGILRGELFFQDGELGMAIADDNGDGQFIPHRTFSGTEAAIAFAALQAALGASAPVRLVVLDELGRVDAENKWQLLKNVRQALNDGIIDQAIAIDVSEPRGPQGIDLDENEWTIISRSA